MSHYAKVENGLVTQVIVAEQDFIDMIEGEWVQTSYNTRGGVHYNPNSDIPSGGPGLRGNFAGIGYTYRSDIDAFIPPKPFDSWVYDEQKFSWKPPVSMPQDGRPYQWDEQTQTWQSEGATE